jgi:Uma2 family endonuclease
MSAILDLPEVTDRHAFNLARWREICAESAAIHWDGRVESDSHGHLIMIPPPGFSHASYQGKILRLLNLPGGESLPEVPVSTAGGIRGIDVAWLSDTRRAAALRENVLTEAPEICVEIISPGNTRAEMEEKRALLFEAGAAEVWFCDLQGRLSFHTQDAPDRPAARSRLCPEFPARL